MLPLILVAVGAYLIGDSVLEDKKYAKGGKTQGYDDKEDERLAMEHGKMAKKDLDSTHARRDDAEFEERGKMAKGGMLEHGMKQGDKIKGSFDNVVIVENGGKIFVVNLNTGKRWSESAWVSANHGNDGMLAKMEDGGYMAKGGKLVGKQKNLDVNKNGKLDAEDFKMLRKGK